MTTRYNRYDYEEAVAIILRASAILALKWTNRGFKLKRGSEVKRVCIIGALDIATKQITKKPYIDTHPATTIVQNTAIKLFGVSAVTVNDDLGYAMTMALMAEAANEGFKYVIGTSPILKRNVSEATGDYTPKRKVSEITTED